jgi:hypothetical protein
MLFEVGLGSSFHLEASIYICGLLFKGYSCIFSEMSWEKSKLRLHFEGLYIFPNLVNFQLIYALIEPRQHQRNTNANLCQDRMQNREERQTYAEKGKSFHAFPAFYSEVLGIDIDILFPIRYLGHNLNNEITF